MSPRGPGDMLSSFEWIVPAFPHQSLSQKQQPLSPEREVLSHFQMVKEEQRKLVGFCAKNRHSSPWKIP